MVVILFQWLLYVFGVDIVSVLYGVKIFLCVVELVLDFMILFLVFGVESVKVEGECGG